MRLTTKSACIGALAFLPIVVVLGCPRSPDGGKPVAVGALPVPEEQFVSVTLADKNPGTKPIPCVNPVHLNKLKGHVAHWVLSDIEGELTITMKKDDPFEPGSVHQGKHWRSGKLKPSAKGKYGYTITVTIPGIKDPFVNDPDIEIMD
jgi:hypothetical protein